MRSDMRTAHIRFGSGGIRPANEIHSFAGRIPPLPNRMCAVRMSERTGENRPVRPLPHFVGIEPVAGFVRPFCAHHRVVLVTRFRIETGFYRLTRIIPFDHRMIAEIMPSVPGLGHVEVQPWFTVEIIC